MPKQPIDEGRFEPKNGVHFPRIRIGNGWVEIDSIAITTESVVTRNQVTEAYRTAWESLRLLDPKQIVEKDRCGRLTGDELLALKKRLTIDVLRGFIEPWKGRPVDDPFDHVLDTDIYLFLSTRFGTDVSVLGLYYQLLTGLLDRDDAQFRMRARAQMVNR